MSHRCTTRRSDLPAEMCNFRSKNHQACSPCVNNSFLSGESGGTAMHHVLPYVCHSRSRRCSLGTCAVLLGIICSWLICVVLAESPRTRGRDSRPDNGGVSIMAPSQATATATATRTHDAHEHVARQQWLIRRTLWTPGNDLMINSGDARIALPIIIHKH